jgi:four helix bundle protein
MTPQELETRLKKYAHRIVALTGALPNSLAAKIIKGQIIRAAFSAAANYRSACKGYTKKAFAAKLAIAFEEIDESVFWLEGIIDLKLINPKKTELLIKEGTELTKILAQSLITANKAAPLRKA